MYIIQPLNLNKLQDETNTQDLKEEKKTNSTMAT